MVLVGRKREGARQYNPVSAWGAEKGKKHCQAARIRKIPTVAAT